MSKRLIVAVAATLAWSAGVAYSDPTTRCFQDDIVDGYMETRDTEIDDSSPDDFRGDWPCVTIDVGPGEQNVLIRFENIFGAQADQIPFDADIVSAQLTVSVCDDGGNCGTNLHRLLIDWDENSTWNSLDDGVQTDGTDALSAVDGTWPDSVATNDVITIDIDIAAIQAWQSDPAANFGWVMVWQNTDIAGVGFGSREALDQVDRPKLCIEYTPRIPTVSTWGMLALVLCVLVAGTVVFRRKAVA